MNKIAELKQERYALRQEALGLLDKAENGKLSPENEERYQKIDKDIDGMTLQIERLEKMQEAQRAEEERNTKKIEAPEQRNGSLLETNEYRNAFMAYLQNPENLTSEQRNMLNAEKRALSAVTGASGGFTVPEGFRNQIDVAMKYYGGMLQANTTKLRTDAGNDIPVPTSNDTSNVGELLAENAGATPQDVAFGQVILKAYKYSSKTVLVPFELLQDSAFNMETFLAERFGERLGRITNTHFTTGDNSSKPQGVVTGSVVGKTGTTGQTTSVIYDDLVDLVHSVDVAYRPNGQFMMNDTTVRALKKLKDTTGRPIWVPGVDVKEPDTILGYRFIVNNHVATMAANAKSILFGDFSKYFIRTVSDIQLYRISDKYIENGQVGFLAFWRGDGRMVDAGTNPIKFYANSAT